MGSIRRSTRRPTVDLPQPDSPTMASVSPASSWKSTPSTARTWPDTRPKAPRRTGKCLARPATSQERAHWITCASGARRQRVEMARRDLDQRRRLGAAGGLDEGAARGEAAAVGRPAHVGHAALDRGQALALLVEARDRAQQAHRVGMLGPREEIADGGALDDLAGVHDGDIVGHLGDDAEIVGDQDDGGAGVAAQPAHQVEDLRLDGDVERGGRLVGDQQLAARRPAPWRSWRAGACRPTACADSRRRASRARGCARVRSISMARARASAADKPWWRWIASMIWSPTV